MNEHVPSNLVLGTAGHIDHGKSSLVRALTGTDPDRLKEEKKRGITIELGFAQLELPSGTSIGIVDVPGHEKFIRQMISGATGIDMALLCIAADDGFMPQTEEHLTTISMLGIPKLMVAITKCDLVDEDWVEMVKEDIARRLAATPYADAPMTAVSSATGLGLQELLEVIDKEAVSACARSENGCVRMPIDRAFSIKGAGTVVTGSLWSGTVRSDDVLEVLPSGKCARVREVQEHSEQVVSAVAGNRVALNLNGLDADEVRPGDFLVTPRALTCSDRFDAIFNYPAQENWTKPFVSGSKVHIAHGTKEVTGRMLLMDGLQELGPGESSFAQIRLDEPLPIMRGDHYIVRSYSPLHVIGGGTVLDSHPRRRSNLSQDDKAYLEALASGDEASMMAAALKLTSLPKSVEDLAKDLDMDASHASTVIESIKGKDDLAAIYAERSQDGEGAAKCKMFYCSKELLPKLYASIETELVGFHEKDKESTGMSKDSLRQKALPAASPELFDALISAMSKDGCVLEDGGYVSHKSAGSAQRNREDEALEAVRDHIEQCGIHAPTVDEILREIDIDPDFLKRILRLLEDRGDIIRLEQLCFDANALGKLKQIVIDRIKQSPATASELKDAMGLTRKHAIPVLEYLDSVGVTKREENLRVLK